MGVDRLERLADPGDNGVYVIDGWKIVAREGLYSGFVEQAEYDFSEMLHALDEAMQPQCQLGEYLDAVEVPVPELRLGDEVWMRGVDGLVTHPVVGFSERSASLAQGGGKLEHRPFVAMYDHDGNWSWNPNNHPKGDFARIRPRR